MAREPHYEVAGGVRDVYNEVCNEVAGGARGGPTTSNGELATPLKIADTGKRCRLAQSVSSGSKNKFQLASTMILVSHYLRRVFSNFHEMF